ncbi:MAG: septal ring lytic transglycosylase RlpA family protein [Nitriliruptorales bacterium]|nr:septal ring lytic transglycosylase RlpA family protein [Nitriliruptorales bacterium]
MRIDARRATQLLAVAAAVLLAGNVLVLQLVREVTVIVDGEPVTVRTFEDTVIEAVASLGIEPDQRDLLVPAGDQQLVGGETIQFVDARPVPVMLDGQPLAFNAPVLTVADVVSVLDLPYPTSELWLNQPLGADVGEAMLRIRLPRDVTIAVDGQVHEVTTTMLTVSAALDEAGVELGPDDMVDPGLRAPLEDGDTILIARVEEQTITVEESIPFETVTRKTDELYRGHSRTVQKGVNGVLEVTYRLTLVDGEETERERLDSQVVREPTTRIIEKGTKDYPPGVNGIDEGLASYYGCDDGLHGNRTANGEVFDENAMTAAHRTLPFGTMVTVESHRTGRTVQVRINDRGPAAWTGKIIDLSCGAMKELAGVADGRHPVTITW